METIRLPTAMRGYGSLHQRIRAEWAPAVASGDVRCARCGELVDPTEPWDLGHTDDRSGYRGPEHVRCNRGAASRPGWVRAQEDLPPERDGLSQGDERWRVSWLAEFLDVPDDATWPRFMTVPHPRAVDSLGVEFVEFAEGREGRRLRWWQRLVAARLLEVDKDGRLVWDTLVLTVARQVGKSWLLRELCLWRMQQSGWFGEPQDIVHTGKDLEVCREVQRDAVRWAREQPELFKVRMVNGQEGIEYLPDRARWMLRAKESAYGHSVSVGAVDEAWKVKAATVDESLVPTMVEREQPQLLLISTAHRRSEALMLQRRKAALSELETGLGDLLVEWSTPRDVPLDDVAGWRLASPHWTPQRESMVRRQLASLRAGEVRDPSEPDPEESFRSQWRNEWPRRLELAAAGEQLLPDGVWERLADSVEFDGPIWLALEDDGGAGSAVGVASRLPDGRIEVGAWRFENWDLAIGWARRLFWRSVRETLVGATMLDRIPEDWLPPPLPAAQAQTKIGLAVFRDLAMTGQLVHDGTIDLDYALGQVTVREMASGLMLGDRGAASVVVKAAAWAVAAAHAREFAEMVY